MKKFLSKPTYWQGETVLLAILSINGVIMGFTPPYFTVLYNLQWVDFILYFLFTSMQAIGCIRFLLRLQNIL